MDQAVDVQVGPSRLASASLVLSIAATVAFVAAAVRVLGRVGPRWLTLDTWFWVAVMLAITGVALAGGSKVIARTSETGRATKAIVLVVTLLVAFVAFTVLVPPVLVSTH